MYLYINYFIIFNYKFEQTSILELERSSESERENPAVQKSPRDRVYVSLGRRRARLVSRATLVGGRGGA